MPRIAEEKLGVKRQVEDSHSIRACVQVAREHQRHRFAGTALTRNTEMRLSEVRNFCRVEPAAEQLLQTAMHHFQLSVHACQRVLKVARTIADLARSDLIAVNHLAEAIQYRPREAYTTKNAS